MKQTSRLAFSPLLAAMLIATSLPATAQEFSTAHPVASSVIVTSVVSVAVVTAPIWLVSAGLSKAADGSARRSRTAANKAQPLPPLTVQKIEPTGDGGVQIALQNPQAPDDLAVLAWPARADNPAAQVKVGDVLDFQPTPAGAGWTVAAADGTALAFLPTTNAATAQSSQRW